jgi:glutathione S-transferase
MVGFGANIVAQEIFYRTSATLAPMTFRYVTVEEAIPAPGLRMVVVGSVPSPWGEAAKGVFHVKGLDWLAVRLDYENEQLKAWAKQRSGPVAFWNDEPPRDRWNDILLLAERIAPAPSLLPEGEQRALVLGISHEIMGEQGLCWSRRLRMVHAGLQGTGGFPAQPAQYLARKYGYDAQTPENASKRIVEVLTMLTARLKAQRAAGSDYLVGDKLTAADIYAATALALFRPLPEEQCTMRPTTRAAFGLREADTEAALGDVLVEHRDMVYRKHLELPLAL